jgi:uncharacterized membrane protein
MKNPKTTTLIALTLIAVSLIFSIILYPAMPDDMASHWNTKGEVDDYMCKFWGLFLMPIISIGIFLLMVFLPMIDPLRKNVKKFRKYYDGFILGIVAFLFYVYMLSLLWNLGYKFSMNLAIAPAIGILFYVIGMMMAKAKRNWFIGIRTPWTLSSDKVWNKTHKLGGKLFKVAGVLALFGAFFAKYAVWFILVPILVFVVYLFCYSYTEFKKETKK